MYIVAGVRRSWAALAYGLCAAALLAWIAQDSWSTRLITYHQGTDYWEHAAALRALLDSPFDPGDPHLVSDALSPRYTPIYLALALVGKAMGLGILSTMGLAACFNVALYLGGVYWFFSSYFRNSKAPLIALLVLLMTWWDGWHYSNVYQLKLLLSVGTYPSMGALGLTWFCFGAVVQALRRPSSHWRLAVVAGLSCLVLLVHPLTAAMTFTGMGGLVLFEKGPSRGLRGRLLVAITLGGALAHLWPYYSPFEVLMGGSGTESGWLAKASKQLASGKASKKLHMFYGFRGLMRAVGLSLPGLYFAAGLAQRRRHLFVPVGLATMFGLFALNAFVKVPLGHRFILLGMVFVHIAMVVGCLDALTAIGETLQQPFERNWFRRYGLRWIPGILLGGLLTVGAVHNVRVAGALKSKVAGRRRISPVLNYARKVGSLVPLNAVVMGRARHTWSLPAFGAKVVALHHSNPLVATRKERGRAVKTFFSTKTSKAARAKLVEKYGVQYVLVGSRDHRKMERMLAGYAARHKLPGGYRLYEL